MNKTEVIKILAIIKVAYPKFFISTNETETKLQVDTWHDLFIDEPFKTVEQAVKALMCTLVYPPTIADIKAKISFITQPQQLTEQEAWNMVRGAISIYNSVETFKTLSPTLQKLVGSPNQLREWAGMEAQDVEKVVKSNFMRSYTARVKQEAERVALPESTRELIQQLAEGFSVGRITDGHN